MRQKHTITVNMNIVVLAFVMWLCCSECVDSWFRNWGYLELLRGDIASFSALVAEQQGISDPVMRSLFKASVLGKDFEEADAVACQLEFGVDMHLALWLYDRAVLMLDADDVSGAVAALDLVLSHGQVDSALWYRLGSLYREAGAPEQALHAYRVGTEADSDGEGTVGWCHMGITLYTMGEWQRLVDLLAPIWAAAPDSALNEPECRTGAIYLADSLRKLDCAIEAERVYRRLVNLDSDARDWQMYNAQSKLGDIELSRGNLGLVMGYYSQAYNIALEVPTHARIDYERNAWRKLERLAQTVIEDLPAHKWLPLLRQKVVAASDNPGLGILWGLVCEKRCDLDGAKTAYTRVGLLVTDSGFIAQRLENLSWDECAPDIP